MSTLLKKSAMRDFEATATKVRATIDAKPPLVARSATMPAANWQKDLLVGDIDDSSDAESVASSKRIVAAPAAATARTIDADPSIVVVTADDSKRLRALAYADLWWRMADHSRCASYTCYGWKTASVLALSCTDSLARGV